MPPGIGHDYFGMSFQEQQAAEGVSPTLIFSLSVLCVFLILAAQFESWSLPMSVLLGTPTAILGAFLALTVRGFQNNVYVQIGLIMLIGLAAKNAILIISFAKIEYEKGKPIAEAALTGARIRLRPILMTSFAFILGCVPLWLASGSGGVSRQTLGTVVIGGMLGATFVDIFIVPVTFSVVEKLAARFSKKNREEHAPNRRSPTDEKVNPNLMFKVSKSARRARALDFGGWSLEFCFAACRLRGWTKLQTSAHQCAGNVSRRNRNFHKLIRQSSVVAGFSR
jgi:HAE1 family hydrophobic/amphiphilic exporter-1